MGGEYKFNDVPAILKQKGDLLTKSEIQLLIDEQTPKKAIAEALGMTIREFDKLCKAWGLRKPVIDENRLYEEYKVVYCDFKNRVELAEYFGITPSQFDTLVHKWKAAGLEVPELMKVNKLPFTKEEYMEFRRYGMYDKDICSRFGIGKNVLLKHKKEWGLVRKGNKE